MHNIHQRVRIRAGPFRSIMSRSHCREDQRTSKRRQRQPPLLTMQRLMLPNDSHARIGTSQCLTIAQTYPPKHTLCQADGVADIARNDPRLHHVGVSAAVWGRACKKGGRRRRERELETRKNRSTRALKVRDRKHEVTTHLALRPHYTLLPGKKEVVKVAPGHPRSQRREHTKER